MIKNNNFDFLRFVFALFVVVSHSYELSGNSETLSWVNKISNGQIIFSQIGLSGFFVISGFFIFKSLNRSNSLLDYFKKRILRIFPALFFVLLISIALVFFLYKGNTPFFKNPETYSYFLYNFSLYKFQGGIKGVFDSNPYHSINGSLWTIRYEFCLYMVLSLLYYFRKKKNVVIFCLCFISLFLIVMYNFFIERFSGSKFFGFQGAFVLNLGTFFITGSLLASLQFEKLNNKAALSAILFLIFLCSIYLNFYDNIKHVIFPTMLLLIGFTPLPFFSTFGKIGDLSYGIYIYSFPIQQTILFFCDFSLYEFMFYSLIISILFGYLSWHFVEKKALKYKSIDLFEILKLANKNL